MDKLLTPEVLIPILLNVVLAVATVFYLLETRASRKAIVKQFEIAQRQHFVTTTPFLYAGSIERVSDSEDFKVSIVNPGQKLARDAYCVLYEADKKTYRYPTTSRVVVKPNERTFIIVNKKPFTAEEVINRLRNFYGKDNGVDTHLITTSKKSYVLILFTDIEGSIYSVKANYSWTNEDKFSRQRSIFKKLSDPRNS